MTAKLHSAGLLTYPRRPRLPGRASDLYAATYRRIHSSGYCSGLSPDSLIRNANAKLAKKAEYALLHPIFYCRAGAKPKFHIGNTIVNMGDFG